MKKFFAILTIVGFVFFTACGSSSAEDCSSKCEDKTECAKKCCDSEKSEECKSEKKCCSEKKEGCEKSEKKCCSSKSDDEEKETEATE